MTTRRDPIEEACRHWKAHWGTKPTASMAAVTSIMRAQQILLTRLNRQLKPFGLTFARYEALMLLYLSRTGSLPLGKLGQRLQVHPTSVTNTIDGLERLGYVQRVPNQDDRRQITATITEPGRLAAANATATLNETHFRTTPLTRAQLETITKALRTLRQDEDKF